MLFKLYHLLHLIISVVVTRNYLLSPTQQVLLDSIKRGDEILSSGGIIGKVIKTDNEKLTVEISKGINVIIIRSTVADVINKS
mgnify:CR=1 FL=1